MTKTFRTKLFNLTALALVLSLVMPWTAFADELIADGDGLATIGDSALNLGNVNFGSTASGTVNLVMKRTEGGNNVFKDGTQPTVTATSNTSSVSIALNSNQDPTKDNKINIPTNWDETKNATTQDYARASVTVDAAGATCDQKTAKITFTATGVNGSKSESLSRSKDLTVNWTVVNCQVATSVGSISASTSTYGGTTNLSATVSPAGAPGSVSFYINGSSTAIAASYNATTGVALVNNHVHGLNASATAYSVRAVFTSSSASYGSSQNTNSSALTVGKATPTVRATGGIFTYSGSAVTGSGSATGVSGEDLGSVTLSYKQGTTNLSSAPSNVGEYTVTASFAATSNYLAGSDEAAITINRADQVIAWTAPAAITYGTALSAAQLNASVTTGDGTLSYSPAAGTVLNAGTHTLRVDATQTANYSAAYAEREITVNKADSVITWNNPAAITFGTALSGTQLNASANVAGSFQYSVAANTVLNAGTHTLSVTFTPTDAANYHGDTKTVQIVVNKADQQISWSNPAAITYGTLLSATQLNATLTTGNGALTYSHNVGDLLNAGEYTLRVDAAMTNNYNAASKTVTLAVNRATPTVEATGGTYTYDGQAKAATGRVLGVDNAMLGTPSFTYDGLAAAPVNAGTYAVVGSFAGNTNYNPASNNSASIVINKRSLTVSATGQNKVYDGTTNATVTLSTDAVSNDAVSAGHTGASFADKNVGTGKTVTVSGISISGDDARNYTLSNTTASTMANITARAIVVTADTQTKTYGDADPALTYRITDGSLVDGDALTGSLTRVQDNSVGTYLIEQGTLDASSNYSLRFVGANLTINKADLTIKANDASRYYGDANPAFSGSVVSGAKYGESFTVTGSSTASATSAAGSYDIVPSASGTTLSNYNVVAQNGTLTIMKWTLKGFYQPVDMGGVLNTVKNGSSVPLKFEVFKGTTELMDTAIVTALSKQITCGTGLTDDVEVVTTGSTSLRYDSTAGQFVYNWQTPKLVGNCYSVTMTTQDGSSITALFKLK